MPDKQRWNAHINTKYHDLLEKIDDEYGHNKTDTARACAELLDTLYHDESIEDDPVMVLERLVEQRDQLDTTTYDPDETRTQPLTQTEIESIIDRPMPEINPIHVRPSDMPWSKADKAEVIASIIRYDRTEAAWASVDAETARSYVSRHMAESDSDVARLAVKSVKSSYAVLDDREKARVRDEYVTKMDGLKQAIEDADPEELEDVSKYGDKVEELHLEINEIENEGVREELKDRFADTVLKAYRDLQTDVEEA